MRRPKYNIGDKVYHVTPDSEQGIVVNVIYYFKTDEFVYQVAVGWSGSYYCDEKEISIEKTF